MADRVGAERRAEGAADRQSDALWLASAHATAERALGLRRDLGSEGKHDGRQATGAVKKAVGKATGDEKLKAEGAAEKGKGKAKSAVGGMKDAVRGAARPKGASRGKR